MITRRATLGLFAAAPLVTLAHPALAAEPPIYSRRGRAIRGADPVAFFTEGQPVYGENDITHDWMGAIWYFASTENRDLFAANPEAYAPQFGGYCAWAASRGYTARTIPEAWSIVDGKLYLNANLSVRENWLAELPDVIAQGEANWPAILG